MMSQSPLTAIYAGSFDPMTHGHLDVVRRASQLFPRLIVAVGRHPSRNPLFDVEERLEFLKAVCLEIPKVEVASFDGLLVNFAKSSGASVIVRGLRVGGDFEYELSLAQANADLADELDTIFLPTRTGYGFISASLVRDIARHGGDVSRYAPPAVCAALEHKFTS
ncbi:MAG: pantetheine-phosphate adenylyltransferase [Polyangiaceae bacterium]|nr:pantetheine-phosphate adenylyltransferase [Polyangiaceae bacterium]